jgi:GNAT superfamily N-acetyltransferase
MSRSTPSSSSSSTSPSTTTTPLPPTQIQIRLPTPTETQTPLFLHRTTALINAAYSAPSTTLLKPNNPRTNSKEVQTWLESGNFYLAFACRAPSSFYNQASIDEDSANDNEGVPPDQHQQQQQVFPIGTLRLTRLTPTISELGIVTVDPTFRSSGLGRKLIAYAEGVTMRNKAERMRIEVPAPRNDAQGQAVSGKKKYLRAWYEGLGYEVVGKRTLEESVPPGLVEGFEEEVEILVMEKGLGLVAIEGSV